MSRKNIISLVIVLVLILAGIAGGFYWSWGKEARLYSQIENKPELVALWKRAKTMEEKIVQKSEDAGSYMELGLLWKSLGELSNNKIFFERSLLAYERGVEKFGQKNILFYLNAGNVAERLENFSKAESYFKKAIEISPADESGYIGLADLYSYKMKKNKMEVVAVYETGTKAMVNPTPLIYARGSYLRRVGDYKNALADYKILSQNFPDQIGYREIAAELEKLIRENP